MMRRTDSDRPPRRHAYSRRRRTCFFCDHKLRHIDYKDPSLRNFVSDRGKIISAKLSGNCARHQRMLSRAVKVARNLALLPYSAG